jgi:hypothetical protein
MEAIRVADVHKQSDPSWPGDSEMYSLIDPYEIDGKHYEQCIVCRIDTDVAIVACDPHGAQLPGGWFTIAIAEGTDNYDVALRSLGYDDIYDDVTD